MLSSFSGQILAPYYIVSPLRFFTTPLLSYPPSLQSNRHPGETSLDPMYINPETRDNFPKSNLFNCYIGDQVALCNELPERAFLRKGAVYKLLGSDPTPMFHSSDSNEVDRD